MTEGFNGFAPYGQFYDAEFPTMVLGFISDFGVVLDMDVSREMLVSHQKFFHLVAGMFLDEWMVLAIHPYNRKDWALENALAIGFVLTLVASCRWLPLSRISYTLIFIFLGLHEIGAHYTYAEVPYDRWVLECTGGSLNNFFGWERNNFDRVVHFFYGLLFVYPIREIYLRVTDVRGFWGYFLPLDLTMSTSMLFELFEWGAAVIFGGDLGIAYLGTQGDIWDAQKDMAIASLGAVSAMAVTALLNMYLQRDFTREWIDSLRVKHSKPLGEDEIVRLWRKRY